ncbi:MAG: hypothetical protein LAT54_07570, partial [Cryomorphaceae bacterium]|nr:hypothetical protein [Cryomorphaceae bacterium]
MSTHQFLITIALVFATLIGKADVIVFDDQTGSIIIGNKIAYFKDDTQSLSAQDVIQESFNESSVKVPNLGISSSTHWIKFSVNNKTNEPEIYLEFRQPLIDNITIYDATNEDNIIRIGFGGDNFPFSQREIKHPSYFFTLTIEPGETRTFLASIQSGEQILGFFVLSDKAHTMNYTSLSDTLFGLYAGIILALLFYNLFIYITVREKVYLRYVVYILFIGLTQISLQGYAFKIFSPNHPYIANILPYVFSCLVGISAIYFMREFLNSKTRIPKFHNLSYLFEYLYWITLLIPFFGFYNLAYLLVLALAGSISIYMLTAGVLVYKTGYSPAKYYLLGWSMLLVGIIIYVLKDFSVLPTNFVTSYTMPIG